jgi:DNA-binding transcriptional LysR family regulator
MIGGRGEIVAKSKQSYYKGNRLQQLRGFCYAAQTGSVSKAAEMIFLSQPSVSLQIQALEREFGATLFERRGPKIALTPDGQALYDMARPLVDAMDSLRETFLASRKGIETGRVTIAAGESTILYILPTFVHEFSSEHPGIDIKLQNVTGRDGMKLLRADEVDFVVGSMIEVPDDIEYIPAFTYDPMLITPLDHPLAKRKKVTLAEVAQYPLILPPRHLTTWRVVEFVFQKHNLNYRVKLEAGGWEVIKKYVQLGLGISIVTSICLTGDEPLATVSLSRYFPKRTYGLVMRKGKYLSAPASKFLELVKRRHRRSSSSRARKEAEEFGGMSMGGSGLA